MKKQTSIIWQPVPVTSTGTDRSFFFFLCDRQKSFLFPTMADSFPGLFPYSDLAPFARTGDYIWTSHPKLSSGY